MSWKQATVFMQLEKKQHLKRRNFEPKQQKGFFVLSEI